MPAVQTEAATPHFSHRELMQRFDRQTYSTPTSYTPAPAQWQWMSSLPSNRPLFRPTSIHSYAPSLPAVASIQDWTVSGGRGYPSSRQPTETHEVVHQYTMDIKPQSTPQVLTFDPPRSTFHSELPPSQQHFNAPSDWTASGLSQDRVAGFRPPTETFEVVPQYTMDINPQATQRVPTFDPPITTHFHSEPSPRHTHQPSLPSVAPIQDWTTGVDRGDRADVSRQPLETHEVVRQYTMDIQPQSTPQSFTFDPPGASAFHSESSPSHPSDWTTREVSGHTNTAAWHPTETHEEVQRYSLDLPLMSMRRVTSFTSTDPSPSVPPLHPPKVHSLPSRQAGPQLPDVAPIQDWTTGGKSSQYNSFRQPPETHEVLDSYSMDLSPRAARRGLVFEAPHASPNSSSPPLASPHGFHW